MENDIVEKIKKMIWANDLLDLSFNKETLDTLTEDEVSHWIYKLDIFKMYGSRAKLTDLAKVLGAPFDEDILEDENIYVGSYWVSGVPGLYKYNLMNTSEHIRYEDEDEVKGCIRPVIRKSLYVAQVLKKIIDSKKDNKQAKEKKDNQIVYITYGEYPQWAASKELQSTLENEFLENKLTPSGKIYTFPNYLNDLSNFINYTEYVYNNEKYIRVVANPYESDNGSKITLTNNTKVKKGNYVWLKVSPLRWLVDKKTNTIIAKNGLLPFNCRHLNLDYYFKNYMLHDIFYKTGRDLQKLYEPLFQQGLLEQIEKSLSERNQKVSSIIQNINEELQNFSTNDREQEFLKRFMLVVKQVSQLKIQDKASLFYKELQDLASYYVQKMSEFKKYNVLDGVKLMIENDGYILTKSEMMLDDIEKRLFYELKVDYLEVFYNSVLEETKKKGI